MPTPASPANTSVPPAAPLRNTGSPGCTFPFPGTPAPGCNAENDAARSVSLPPLGSATVSLRRNSQARSNTLQYRCTDSRNPGRSRSPACIPRSLLPASPENDTSTRETCALRRRMQLERRVIQLLRALVVPFHLRLVSVLQDFPRSCKRFLSHAHRNITSPRNRKRYRSPKRSSAEPVLPAGGGVSCSGLFVSNDETRPCSASFSPEQKNSLFPHQIGRINTGLPASKTAGRRPERENTRSAKSLRRAKS